MPALAEALAAGAARDPRLAETLAQLKAAEESTRAVGAELRPDLSLTATLSGRAGGAPPSHGLDRHGDGWVPNVPELGRGARALAGRSSTARSSARRDAARVARAGAARRDRRGRASRRSADVRQAYVQVQVARNGARRRSRNAVDAARANYDQADARFRAGIGNAVELADAEALRTDAEIQLALGQFELARARAAFGRAIAEGL